MMFLDSTILAKIDEQLKKIIKHNTEVVSIQKLNYKKHITVLRLKLKGNKLNQNSLIIKYIEPFYQENPKICNYFMEEYLNYKFLTEIRNSFPLYPQLIGSSEELLVLEDLGENVDDYPSEELQWESIATTLAMLHGATANQYPLYTKLRKAMHLNDVDQRIFSQKGYNLYFDLAMQNIKEYCEIFNIKTSNYEVDLDNVKYQVNNPGEFLAFTHNDFACLRQSISKEGQCYLLDFEHGRYSHALLDIGRMIVGKIEMYNIDKNNNINVCGINFPDSIPNFTNIYREKLEVFRQEKFDDRLWQSSISYIFIYSVFLVIGELLEQLKYANDTKLIYSYTSNLNQLLSRLLILLEGNDSHHELKEIFQQLLTRIYF